MSDSPLILSLETATMGGSVFLSEGNQQLATRIGNPDVSQSTSLLADIDDSLKEAAVTLRDVDLFACASGPGSFTGLRIGIATLKALAASLDRSCVGIPTLEAVAHAAGASRATVALLPAGRGEVFAQLFSVSADGTVIELDSPAHLSPQRLVERYSQFSALLWAGSGAQLQRGFLELEAQTNEILFLHEAGDANAASTKTEGRVWRLAPPEVNLAKHVATLALKRYQDGEIQPPHALSAIYIRPSDAELNQQCH